jgi:hypothetical protein
LAVRFDGGDCIDPFGQTRNHEALPLPNYSHLVIRFGCQLDPIGDNIGSQFGATAQAEQLADWFRQNDPPGSVHLNGCVHGIQHAIYYAIKQPISTGFAAASLVFMFAPEPSSARRPQSLLLFLFGELFEFCREFFYRVR